MQFSAKLEKYHLVVKKGIFLWHKISRHGIEVDKATIEVNEKLPPLVSVKGIWCFLRDAAFYKRFIKEFFKITNPLYKNVEKEAKFLLDDTCRKGFKWVKERSSLVYTIVSPDLSTSFEVMCDGSGVTLGAVLGNKK